MIQECLSARWLSPAAASALPLAWPLLAALAAAPLAMAAWIRRPYRRRRGPDGDIRLLFDKSPDLLCVTRLDGRIRESNRAWKETLGYSAEQLAGARLLDLVAAADRDSASAAIEKLHTTPSTSQIVARIQDASGGQRWILWSITTPANEPVILWSGKDITLMKEARLSLERHASELRAENDSLRSELDGARDSVRVKTELLSKASQQIRAPLNGLAGMTELLLTTPLDNEQREYAGTIREAGESLMVVLNGLIEYSRLESKHVGFESIPFDPAAVASGVLLLFSARAQQARVAISSSISTEVPRTVKGDPRRLRQILINLVSNAVQFTPSGSIHLATEVVTRRDGSVSLRFSVRDTGIGIDAGRLDRLFQPFAANGHARGAGHGLGLAITKQLVESLGGQLGVESRLGKGSRFWAVLPFQEIAAPARAAHAAPTPRRRVALVAEDNPINQKLARQLLEREGFAVVIANDGHQAVEAALSRPFDLILMDVHMPEMDGLTATEEIRRRSRGASRVPIIALTAGGARADRESCLSAGMDDFIPKPITSQSLRMVVDRWARSEPAPLAAAAGGLLG